MELRWDHAYREDPVIGVCGLSGPTANSQYLGCNDEHSIPLYTVPGVRVHETQDTTKRVSHRVGAGLCGVYSDIS